MKLCEVCSSFLFAVVRLASTTVIVVWLNPIVLRSNIQLVVYQWVATGPLRVYPRYGLCTILLSGRFVRISIDD